MTEISHATPIFRRFIRRVSQARVLGKNKILPMLNRASLLLLLACSAIPSVSADDYPFKSINRLRRLAGAAAKDCGLVGIGQSRDTANQCAVETFKSGKPFYFGFVSMGIDTRNFEGFAH